MLWEITGWCNNKKLPTLFIEASSFSEAINIAKEQNSEYSCGRLIVNYFRGK